jgi:hypothetical protein
VKAVRTQVATTVASAAGPYGYTITLGGSVALASNALGPPHLGSALLMMLGAVAAFVALEAAARGAVDTHGGGDAPPPSPLANAHVPSAGLALCAVWGLVHIAHAGAGWALTGFVATGVYFIVAALQRVAIDALMASRS